MWTFFGDTLCVIGFDSNNYNLTESISFKSVKLLFTPSIQKGYSISKYGQ